MKAKGEILKHFLRDIYSHEIHDVYYMTFDIIW